MWYLFLCDAEMEMFEGSGRSPMLGTMVVHSWINLLIFTCCLLRFAYTSVDLQENCFVFSLSVISQ